MYPSSPRTGKSQRQKKIWMHRTKTCKPIKSQGSSLQISGRYLKGRHASQTRDTSRYHFITGLGSHIRVATLCSKCNTSHHFWDRKITNCQYICALFVHSTWPIVSSIMSMRTKTHKVKRWKCHVFGHSLVGTEMGIWHSRFSLVDNIPWPRRPRPVKIP